MSIEAIVDIRGIRAISEKFAKFGIDDTDLLETIAQYAMFNIKKRTSAGEDVEERGFIPYTPKYALFRRKNGLPTNKVDLFFSGHMIGAMTSDTTGSEIRLYFQNTTDKSNVKNPLKAWALNMKRNFFALSEKDIKGIEEIIEKYVNKKLG